MKKLLIATSFLLALQLHGEEVKPDNSAINKRDQDHATLTPTDQKENSQDLKITQEIRKSIVADKNLSTYAKNVKIITVEGMVTLRGPVGSIEEKKLVFSKAVGVVGVKNVDDQTDIKSQ